MYIGYNRKETIFLLCTVGSKNVYSFLEFYFIVNCYVYSYTHFLLSRCEVLSRPCI